MSDNILVSIVIPCRNEAAHIATVLKNVNEQDYPTSSIEVLVADGQSDDNTREIVQNFNDTVRKVILLDNPERIVPYALNKAIALAKGQYIIRLDAHTVYASNYVSKIMETFASTGADIVGGPMHAIGKTNLPRGPRTRAERPRAEPERARARHRPG